MDSFTLKKNEYLSRIARFILANGINESSLKKMAEAAETSDRMLMHYFKDKEEIMTLALKSISQELISLLTNDPTLCLDFEEFISFIYHAVSDARMKPYLNLWFELIHLGSNEKEPYWSISKEIGETYWQWLLHTYNPSISVGKEQMVALIYAITEGFVFLDKIGMADKMELALDGIHQLYQDNPMNS